MTLRPVHSLIVVCLTLTLTHAGAQPPAPRFEVSSVKRYPVDLIPCGGLQREVTPAGVTMRCATLGNCFEWAFGTPIYQVIGPSWLNWPTDAAYDIIAKASAPAPQSELKAMMQTLLKERFGLAFHREMRQQTVYAVQVGRGGPQLKPSTDAGEPSMKTSGPHAVAYRNVTMAQLALSLERPFQPVHVVDDTGLAGRFDFVLDLAPYIIDPETNKAIIDSIGRVDETGALVRALPQQLGLRLEKRSAPIEVLVIDHLEKDPTAN